MELNKYQEQAMKTCMESSNNVAYMLYNLIGEVGELCEKVEFHVNDISVAMLADNLSKYSGMAKEIRKNPDSLASVIWRNNFNESYTKLRNDKDLQKEAGDILWQLAGLCSVMGWSLEDIAQQNLDKLADRQRRGKIDGEGDNR